MSDKFIRITGCHMCPWNKSKVTIVKLNGVIRTECGITQDVKLGRFKECPPLTQDSENVPIPEWCPLESIIRGKNG